MLPYSRPHYSEILSRLNERAERMMIITGPRQSGKSTLILQVLQSVDRPWRYLAADDPTSSQTSNAKDFLAGESPLVDPTIAWLNNPMDSRWLVQQWEKARAQANSSEKGAILVIDEVQKIQNWSEVVKGLWDADRRSLLPLHVVLLGTSPATIRKGTSESLTGRFEIIRLSHWSFEEMSAVFNFTFDQYVYFGGYPGAASLIWDEQRWRDYICDSLVEKNIEQDILAMQRVDKPALLKQLVSVCSVFSGQILSYNKMLGQLQDAGNGTTLARYLDLMTEIGLIAGLSKFASGVQRRNRSSPKLNVFNTAIMSAYSKLSFEDFLADRSFRGRLTESAVGAHLLNSAGSEIDIYYWRHNNFEVEFVLLLGQKIIGIEVKSGMQSRNIGGLSKFGKEFNTFNSIVVGGDGIPIPEFLRTPARHWFESNA